MGVPRPTPSVLSIGPDEAHREEAWAAVQFLPVLGPAVTHRLRGQGLDDSLDQESCLGDRRGE
jgi:hypothetical protein